MTFSRVFKRILCVLLAPVIIAVGAVITAITIPIAILVFVVWRPGDPWPGDILALGPSLVGAAFLGLWGNVPAIFKSCEHPNRVNDDGMWYDPEDGYAYRWSCPDCKKEWFENIGHFDIPL